MENEETYIRELVAVLQKISKDKTSLNDFLLDLLTQDYKELYDQPRSFGENFLTRVYCLVYCNSTNLSYNQ